MQNPITADMTGGSEPLSPHPAARIPDGLSRILLRRKLIVIGITALAIAIAVAYILTATKRYTSTARLSVKLADTSLTASAPSDADSANFLATQQEMIGSSSVSAIVAQDPEVANLEAMKEGPTPIAALRKILSVEIGKHDDGITVSAETRDPAEAPIIVKAVIDAYILYQTKPKESSLDNTLAALNKSRDEANSALTNIVVDMTELESRYGISPGSDTNNPVLMRVSDLKNTLDAATTDLLQAQSDYEAAIKALPPTPSSPSGGAVTDDQTEALLAATMDEAQLHDELAQLQLKLSEMRQRYLPKFPALQSLEQRVRQVGQLYVAAIGRRKDLALARRDEIQRELTAQMDAANKFNAESQHYKRLALQADDQRKVIDQLDGRIRALELARDTGSVDIVVAAPPGDATQSSPQKAAALGSALILGLLLGCGLAFVRDRLDDRLHGAEDVRTGLGVKLLGVVPQMPTGISPSVAAQKVALDPASEVAEAYRTIRTALYFGAPKDRSKTILVTSPSVGDGKTTSAANLAIAMAQAGKRVVLVDADLRHPQQHTIFATRDRIGLSTLLIGNSTLDQAVQATNIDNLDLLPCGPTPRNPSELLNSGTFVELLESLAERYDQVVVDSPPVMAFADARIIAASCDLTVMVLRAQKSTRKRSTLARDGLLGVGARLLGIIVNDVPKTNGEYHDSSFGYPAVGRDNPSHPRLSGESDTTRALPHSTLRRPG
jgi:succinoglycan biosynthesis transport protein ExoP